MTETDFCKKMETLSDSLWDALENKAVEEQRIDRLQTELINMRNDHTEFYRCEYIKAKSEIIFLKQEINRLHNSMTRV